MNRRQFVQTSLLGASVVPKMRAGVAPESDIANTSVAVPGTKLFPTELPELQWREFRAAGFEAPVAGVIYRPANPPCCGVPLGGISTGCIDLDVKGVYGFSSAFNPWSQWPHRTGTKDSRMPRKAPSLQPLLGLAVGGETWVLTTEEILKGGELPYCLDPGLGKSGFKPIVNAPQLQGVNAARAIHYWGHFPIADMEFDTDAPVSVGLRAWAPFIPGDTPASNIPAVIFEVRLRNTSNTPQKGTLAFNFPGPDSQEAMTTEFARQEIDDDFQGVFVASEQGVNYFLGAIGTGNLSDGFGFEPQRNGVVKDYEGIASAQPAGVGWGESLHGCEQLGSGGFFPGSRRDKGSKVSSGLVCASVGEEGTNPPSTEAITIPIKSGWLPRGWGISFTTRRCTVGDMVAPWRLQGEWRRNTSRCFGACWRGRASSTHSRVYLPGCVTAW